MLHHRGNQSIINFFFRIGRDLIFFLRKKKSHIFVHPSIDCILIKQTKYMYM